MPLKRKLIFLIVAVVLTASAAGAYAATQTSKTTPRQAFFNDVARRLHVTPTQLKQAVDGAFADRLSALVAAGRLTKTEAKAIEQRMKNAHGILGAHMFFPGMFFPGLASPGARLKAFRAGRPMPPGWYGYPPPPGVKMPPGAPVPQAVPAPRGVPVPPGVMVPPGAPGPPGVPMPPGIMVPPGVMVPPGAVVPRGLARPGMFRLGPGAGLFPAGIRAATSYLGISLAKLQSELSSGKSLAKIASAEGKTKSGLESAVESKIKSRIDREVAAKRLTGAQAKMLLSAINARVAAIVNAPPPRVAWRVYKFRARQQFRRFWAP